MKKTTKKKFLRKLLLLLACTGCLCAASCAKEKIRFVFDSNGGEAIAESEVEKGGSFTLPVPVREGYEFEGWYTTADFSGAAVEKIDQAQENLTFYAKWAKKYTVTLDAAGGTLSASSLQVKAGENLYELLQAYRPEKSGYVFGAWFDEKGNEISKNLTMPESDVAFTARYKVGYTVQIYKQNPECTEYVKDETDLTYYDYVGTQVKASETFRGFKETKTENTVAFAELTEDASKNVLKLYFNRETFTVRFDGNYPDSDSSEGNKREISVIYGKEIQVPCDYEAEGYCLTGWSATKNGPVVYKTGNVALATYGQEDAADTSDVFLPERNMTLYAVWSKGYTDMFGGEDYIYLFGEENKEVYLCRGGVFFKGSYDEDKGTFSFKNSDGDYIGRGKIVSADAFAYLDDSRNATTATLYNMAEGKTDENVYIEFDVYNGLKYFVKSGEEGAPLSESEGKYVKDENGYFTATFTSGDMQGKTLTFFRGTLSNGNEVFVARNDEEMLRLPRFFVANSSALMTYDGTSYKGYMDITLDGFGVASLNTGTDEQPDVSRFYYVKDGNTITLRNSSRMDYFTFRIIEHNAKKGYYIYRADLDKTITADDGSSLTTDGLYNLSYRNKDGVLTEGMFTASEAILGDYLLSMTKGDETYRFLISSATEEKLNGEGETETVTTYRFERKPEGYAEYYYQNSDGTQRGPLLVIDDTSKGSAAIYEYISATKTYKKASDGTYLYDSDAKTYTYEAANGYETEGGTGLYEASKVKTAVFALDTQSTSYKIYYWYSLDDGENNQNYETEYTCSSQGVTLKKIGGIMVLDNKGVVTSGTFKTSSGVTTIQSGSGSKAYVKIDEEARTFELLWTSPYSAYFVNEYGATDRTRYLTFDGTGTSAKGGATYVVVTDEKDEQGNAITKYYTGAFEETEENHPFTSAIKICRFTGTYNDTTETFRFIRVRGSSSVLIYAYGEKYNGEYRSENDGRISLDGYGYIAIYTDAAGNNSAGAFAFSKSVNDLMYFQTESGDVFLFDLKTDKSFTRRGNEYGVHVFAENQELGELFAETDGYGRLSVYTLEKVTEGGNTSYEKRYIDENGSYVKNGDAFILRYTADGETVEVTGELRTYTSGNNSISCFVVYQKDVVAVTYVNPADWSLMILDKLGNAVKYDQKGNKESGTYTLITDELLYYVNARGTDASVYAYDSSEKTIIKREFTKQFGYFTKELDSMLFTKFGVAVIDGERCYYEIDDNDGVVVYKKARTGGNEFGYIAETFLSSTDQKTKEYNGKTYYINDGYALRFTRDVSSKEKYPYTFSDVGKVPTGTLDFTPSGTAEYTVSGTVTFNYTDESGKQQEAKKSCTVTREATESESGEITYVMYMTFNNHRFDIRVNYNGAEGDNTYSVTGLAFVYSYSSFNYTFYSYLYSMLGGVSPLADPGTISVKTIYDENGGEVARRIVSDFTENSGYKDSEGNLFAIDAEYTFENRMYTADFTGKDGKDYRLYMQPMNQYGISGYTMMITRVETLTDGDYTVTVERVAASEGGYSEGAYVSMLLKKGETEYTYDTIFRVDATKPWIYVVRTYDDDKKITSTVYYEIALTEETASVDEDKMTFFTGVAVTEKAIVTYYTEEGRTDGKSFADVHATEGVKLIVVNGTGYIVSACDYDESAKTYTARTPSGKTFTVKITSDDTAEITEITEETDENA